MIFPEEKKIDLHMFLVFYSIDVLVVGKDMKIKEIKRNFKPFTAWSSNEKGKYVVELVSSGKYEVGDSISWKERVPAWFPL